jgi:hypothetical protein
MSQRKLPPGQPQKENDMKLKLPGMLAVALVTAALPAAIVFAQTQAPKDQPARADRRPGLSADARARLLEGRLAMAKTALNLTSEQLQLWGPVEAQIRSSITDRAQRRQEMRAKRAAGEPRERLSLPDRLDRASQRMAQRAERMKAFAAVIKPFYASLNDEQKAVAGVVLRQMRGGDGWRGRGPRWAMQPGPGNPAEKQ